jgi:putative transposase
VVHDAVDMEPGRRWYDAFMPGYIRADIPGGVFFFTVVTYRRRRLFDDASARSLLRMAFQEEILARPFAVDAIVLLPDHLHCIWTLPEGEEGDGDFSTRWRRIKERFTRSYLAGGGAESLVSTGKAREHRRGVWQSRFWEHAIRDEEDFRRHLEYIHYNPVKHGYVRCPHAWPWSSFSRWVKMGVYDDSWCCVCEGDGEAIPGAALDYGDLERYALE